MNFNQQNPWGSLPQYGQQQGMGQMPMQMAGPGGFAGQMGQQMTPPIMQGMPGQQQPSGQMPMMGDPFAHQGHQQQDRGMFGANFMQRIGDMMPHFMNSRGAGFPFMNRQQG